MKLLLLLSLALAPAVTAFVPTRTALVRKPLTMRADMSNEKPNSAPEKALPKQFLDKLSTIKLDFNADAVRGNMSNGAVGQRGELYFVAQSAIVLCILIGGIPFIGDILFLLLGPAFLIVGGGTLVLGLSDLGDSLTPWPVPPEGDTGLKTGGLYAQVRHPIYAGLLAAMTGLSLITGSVNRLLLTALLLYCLDIKADYEEGKLMEKFPDYAAYKDTVTGRFVPSALTNALPWSKKE